ncbi:hypothetical protein DERP_009292 [Dermatophagoides pteronyssinus]|uniref:Secreted protein n=1 Tax=Dermatophagoides pteronyssinus TaxID=6956 RepID=A0ABQ8ITQ3_DERPT|nr:hypothetical protein DERP_009292 [Dermatophagoides pteronyssinus]
MISIIWCICTPIATAAGTRIEFNNRDIILSFEPSTLNHSCGSRLTSAIYSGKRHNSRMRPMPK